MISIRGLVVSFGEKQVLNHISLDVNEGEIFVIMGSSGGGKTTLLRAISGLQPFQAGEIHVDGISVREKPEEVRKRLGMVFQYAALFDSLDVRDNVLFGIRRQQRLDRAEETSTLESLLAEVSLQGSEALMPAELSGGMRKRVGLARALAMKPKVILYDEPTSGLDPITAYSIDQLIVETRDHLKVTSVVVSHDVTSIFRVANRIAFLANGSLEFVGTVSEFRESKNSEIVELVQKAEATSFGD